MSPSFPPAYNSSPQAFIKPGLGKWGKHPILPQIVFLCFKFQVQGEKKMQVWGVLWCALFFQQIQHMEQPPTHPVPFDSPILPTSGEVQVFQVVHPGHHHPTDPKSQRELEMVWAGWFKVWSHGFADRKGPFYHNPPPAFRLFVSCMESLRLEQVFRTKSNQGEQNRLPRYSCCRCELKCPLLEFRKMPGAGVYSHHGK